MIVKSEPMSDTTMGIVGASTVSIDELNQQATYRPPSKRLQPPMVDPLDGIEVTREYTEILELIQTGFPVVFITGKAGTGKSVFIQYLRAVTQKNIVVVAPTGVAALNAKGATIHSFFRLPPRIVNDENLNCICTSCHILSFALSLLLIANR